MKGLDIMLWFNDCRSIEDVKERYKKLCKQYHPDITGTDTNAQMSEINTEYTKAFEMLKNTHRSAEDSTKTYTSNTNTTETAAEFMEIINALIACEGLEINLVGRWIWLTGNTFSYKDKIKALGFRWASKKKSWYYRKDEDACKSYKNLTLEDIMAKYGCKSFETIATPKLTTA